MLVKGATAVSGSFIWQHLSEVVGLLLEKENYAKPVMNQNHVKYLLRLFQSCHTFLHFCIECHCHALYKISKWFDHWNAWYEQMRFREIWVLDEFEMCFIVLSYPWKTLWHHQMETFFALLALCAGNPAVTDEFPAQSPVTRMFDVFFDLRLSKRLSKQSGGWWFETPSSSLWRHCNDFRMVDWHTWNHRICPSACGENKCWEYFKAKQNKAACVCFEMG